MKSKSMVLLFAGLALIAGCASQPSDGQEHAPLVKIDQLGNVLEMGVEPSGGLPMQYRLTIQNPFDHEVKLRFVEIESVGQAGGYHLRRVRQNFDETVAAGAARDLNIRAWVRVLTESDMRSVDHPVLLRGVAQFDSPSGTMTRKFSARVNDTSRTTSH